MVELQQIFRAIILGIPTLVSLFVLWYQRRTKKEVEELRHDLSKERFFTEKTWDERRHVYGKLSNIGRALHYSITEIKGELDEIELTERGDPEMELRILRTCYIFDKYLKEKSVVRWNEVLARDGAEKERDALNSIDIKDNIEDLWKRFFDMGGDVKIFGTEDTKKLYKKLIEISRCFTYLSREKACLLTRDVKSESEIENEVRERMARYLLGTTKGLNEINQKLNELNQSFESTYWSLIEQMKEDLEIQ